MSRVYDSYMADLAEAIINPSSLALQFQVQGIIAREVQRAITDKGNTETALDKTIRLLNAVGNFVRANEDQIAKVVDVFRRCQDTKRIAEAMAENG